MLRVALDVAHTRRALALRALEFASAVCGLRVQLVVTGADLTYSERDETDASGRTLRCDPAYYEPGTPFRAWVDHRDGTRWWVPAFPTPSVKKQPDYLGMIVRLMGLLDEQTVSADADRQLSAFSVGELPAERQLLLDHPVCDHAARRFFAASRQVPPNQHSGFWPGAARFAVALTHDVDGPEIGRPGEVLRSLAKLAIRRERKYAWAARSGMRHALRGTPGPLWGFRDWAGLERRNDIRSAFYVYSRLPGNPRHLHDPQYRLTPGGRWTVLRELAGEGWEIGVHAGIRSRESVEYLRREREHLQSHGIAASGVRHHYWEINWRSPWETFRRHVDAGFQYDTSVAWKDRPGFRCATSFPFRPWDPTSGDPIDLIVIPTCLMDGHLFEYLALDEAAAFERAMHLIGEVRNAGGVVVMDWHERTYADTPLFPGWRRVCEAIISRLREDQDVWWSVPREIASVARERYQEFSLQVENE